MKAPNSTTRPSWMFQIQKVVCLTCCVIQIKKAIHKTSSKSSSKSTTINQPQSITAIDQLQLIKLNQSLQLINTFDQLQLINLNSVPNLNYDRHEAIARLKLL